MTEVKAETIMILTLSHTDILPCRYLGQALSMEHSIVMRILHSYIPLLLSLYSYVLVKESKNFSANWCI